MKKNKMMRAAGVLMVVTLLTMSFVSGDSEITWSKKDGSLIGSFALSHGKKVKIDKIPAGVEYKVEEEKLADYTVKKEGDKGTIKEGETATAHFLNSLKWELPNTGGTEKLQLLKLGAVLIIGGAFALMYALFIKNRRNKIWK